MSKLAQPVVSTPAANQSPSLTSEAENVENVKPTYWQKLGLTTNGIPAVNSPKRVALSSTFFSGLFSFIGIYVVMAIDTHTDFVSVVASFGASAVLIYDAVGSPLAQPRNVIGGQMISAFMGVCMYKLFNVNNNIYLPAAGAAAVSTAIMAMDLTRTLHPPGGATALIAVVGSDKIHDLGFMYVVYPIGVGITIMVVIAVILNNLLGSRRYPKFWY